MKLKEANIDRAMTAMMSANASREELFILSKLMKQRPLERKLRDENLDVTKGQAKAAIAALNLLTTLELAEFRRLEAIKAAEKQKEPATKLIKSKKTPRSLAFTTSYRKVQAVPRSC